MFFRITGPLLLMSLLATAQQGDDKGVKMDPVVPEKLIPPSPVLTVDQALKTFDLAPGFIIEPVAAEPLVDTPVCLDFDPAGRMWVCEMRGYMPDIDGKKESDPQGRIVTGRWTSARFSWTSCCFRAPSPFSRMECFSWMRNASAGSAGRATLRRVNRR
jgi:hypothetical protein